jgi:hypothetical protein
MSRAWSNVINTGFLFTVSKTTKGAYLLYEEERRRRRGARENITFVSTHYRR